LDAGQVSWAALDGLRNHPQGVLQAVPHQVFAGDRADLGFGTIGRWDPVHPAAEAADLVRRYGPSLVLLEHHPAPELSEGTETLDLVRIGADGSPHWSRVWPTPEDNPRHAGLELWMAVHGHRIVSRPGSWSDSCEGEDD
jgi:hypothetical protein